MQRTRDREIRGKDATRRRRLGGLTGLRSDARSYIARIVYQMRSRYEAGSVNDTPAHSLDARL